MTATKQFKYLIKVEPGANNNKFYRMSENDDGTFTATYGRVGAEKPATEIYPMSKWDSKLREKLSSRKGYSDKTELFAEVKQVLSTPGVIASDTEVANFIIMLQGFAQAQTAQTYLVQAEAVTQKQIDVAQEHLDRLSHMAANFGTALWNINDFNAELINLFKTIPRKMKHVGEELVYEYEGYWDAAHKVYEVTGKKKPSAQLKKAIEELIGQEQTNLDSMAGQVTQNAAVGQDDSKAKHTMLDSLGLELKPVKDPAITKSIKQHAQEHAHRVRRIFQVTNKSTQSAFDAHLKNATNKKCEIFWHGSRRQNWWFILQQGLRIRPSTAVYTGSMFGDGIYFASECDKSMGYTDGGRWTGSRGNGHVYMALYEVHVGKQYVTESSDSSLNYNSIQRRGCDSTWGKKGRSLMRNEYIIYKPSQCTIRYIVEFD